MAKIWLLPDIIFIIILISCRFFFPLFLSFFFSVLCGEAPKVSQWSVAEAQGASHAPCWLRHDLRRINKLLAQAGNSTKLNLVLVCLFWTGSIIFFYDCKSLNSVQLATLSMCLGHKTWRGGQCCTQLHCKWIWRICTYIHTYAFVDNRIFQQVPGNKINEWQLVSISMVLCTGNKSLVNFYSWITKTTLVIAQLVIIKISLQSYLTWLFVF